MQEPRRSHAEQLHAADAHHAINVLKKASNATTLVGLEGQLRPVSEKFAVAASEPQCHAAYCNILGQQKHIQLLIQSTCNLVKLASGQQAASAQRLLVLSGLPATLRGVLENSSKWECYGFNSKEAARWMMETGLLTQAMRVATEVTATLNSYAQANRSHQELHAQQACKQCCFAACLLHLWQGISALGYGNTVMDLDILATLEPAAGLAFAILRYGQQQTAPPMQQEIVHAAAYDALRVAWQLANFVTGFIGEAGRQPAAAAASTRHVLAAADVQQLLLVHVASLAAGLHRLNDGHRQVSIRGAEDSVTQLDVPAWHDLVLKQLSAAWVGLTPQGKFACPRSVSAQNSSATRLYEQLSQALFATHEALIAGSSNGSTQLLRGSMALPLLRMLIEVAALMPETEVVQLCICCSLLLFGATHGLALGQDSCEVICDYRTDSSAPNDQATCATTSPASMESAVTAAALLPPVLNLLAPAVLHVLSLDSDSGFQRHLLLHPTADKGDLTLTRLAIVGNVSSYILQLVTQLGPKHLAAVVFHKPVTSLSILEAAIRNISADAVAPSSIDSSLGRASQFLQQWLKSANPKAWWQAVSTSSLLAEAIDAAAATGKLMAVLSAPPGSTQAQHWEGLFCRQLSGFMITSLKLQQHTETKEGISADRPLLQEAQITCARHILSSVVWLGAHMSRSGTAETAGGVDPLAAAAAEGSHSGHVADAALLCVAVAGRGLRLLGLAWGPEADVAALPGPLPLAQGTTTQHLLLNGSSQTAAAAAEWAITRLLACSRLPVTVKEHLLQQHGQLHSTLELVTRLGTAGQMTASQRDQLRQLPELLKALGTTVSAWVPQQQWCHNVDCCNLGMLRESALVSGQGKVCAECRLVRYCGRECQVQDWSQHKHACKAWRVAQL